MKKILKYIKKITSCLRIRKDYPFCQLTVYSFPYPLESKPSRYPLIAHLPNNHHNSPAFDNNVEDKFGQVPYNPDYERSLKLEPLSSLSPVQQQFLSALAKSDRNIHVTDGRYPSLYEILYQFDLKQRQIAKEGERDYEKKPNP